jgi:hypothetical protein
MQLCLAATAGFKELTTLSGSEPFLAEAALQLVHDSGANPVHHLANYPDLNCLKIGRGELVVAALIIMQARDTAVAAQPPTQGRRWVSVSDFMRALLPNEKFIELQGSLPTSCRVGEDRPFVETFQNYAMWYNHVIRIEADDMINTKLLWSFITRGAMIMAPYNQSSVDIVLPLCLKTGKLSRSTVSAMLIQVKTSDKYGYDIDEALFGGLSPFRVGLFDSGSTPRPVIRMVFALTSSKSGIHLPEVRERPRTSSHQDFTAFDIWCAGLSSFKNICEDLASYEILLGRSLRPREFELLREDADLNDATRELRELRRQTMAALPMLHDEHP